MSVEDIIHQKLHSLSPVYVQLVNESHMHAAQAAASHFKLVLVSEAFAELRPVARHQKIYQLLATELAGPVHALALHLYTPEEWQQSQVPDSPNCMGQGQ